MSLEAVQRLHQLRQELKSLEVDYENAAAVFDAETADNRDRWRRANEQVKTQQALVESAARTLFQISPEANGEPFPGVKVEKIDANSYSLAEATKWALEQRMFVAVQLPELRRFIEAFPKQCPFVKSAKRIKVTIATDLGAPLAGTQLKERHGSS